MKITFRVVKERWYHRLWDYFFAQPPTEPRIGQISIDVDLYHNGKNLGFKQQPIVRAVDSYTLIP